MSSKMLFTYQQHFCRQVQSLLFLKDEPHIKLVQNGLDIMTYLKKKKPEVTFTLVPVDPCFVNTVGLDQITVYLYVLEDDACIS